MSYFIIRREISGILSYSTQDNKPDYTRAGLGMAWRRDNELVMELRANPPSLSVLKRHTKYGTLMQSGFVKQVVNTPVARQPQPGAPAPGKFQRQPSQVIEGTQPMSALEQLELANARGAGTDPATLRAIGEAVLRELGMQ